MNEQPLNDPKLVAFEARLAALAPSVSRAEGQKLLYECAFAAGRKTAGRALWRWQALVAALVVVALGMSVPLVQDRLLLARRKIEPKAPVDVRPESMIARPDIPLPVRRMEAVELDAWQLEPAANSLAVSTTDPVLRSLSVSALTREVLKP